MAWNTFIQNLWICYSNSVKNWNSCWCWSFQLVKTPHSDPKEWTACIDLKEWTVYFRTHQWLIVVPVSFSAKVHVALQLLILVDCSQTKSRKPTFTASSWDKLFYSHSNFICKVIHSGQPPCFSNPSTAELTIHINFTDNWFYTPSHPAVKYIRL